MRYIIDRLEEELAICEDELKKMRAIPVSQLPEGVKEGDIITEQEGQFFADPEARKERQTNMRKKLMDLFI